MNTTDRAVRQDRAAEWLRANGHDDPNRPSPADAVRFRNVADLRSQVTADGDYTFTRDTMRYRSSRVVGPLIGGRFIITSDADVYDDGQGRRYTVRYVTSYERTVGGPRRLRTETLSTHATISLAQNEARYVLSVLFGYGR